MCAVCACANGSRHERGVCIHGFSRGKRCSVCRKKGRKMKRVRTTFDDLQSLSDATDGDTQHAHHIEESPSVAPAPKKCNHDPLIIQMGALMNLKRKCSSCSTHLPSARNTEFLCESSVCNVYVYHLCAPCQGRGISTKRCPKGFGCEK